MKKKTLRGSCRRERSKMKGTLTGHLTVQLGQVSLLAFEQQQQERFSAAASIDSSRFQALIDSKVSANAAVAGAPQPQFPPSSSVASDANADASMDDKDFILSQDFFCTPDYITPDGQNLLNSFNCNKENVPCPKSPDKLNTLKSKRRKKDLILADAFPSTLPCHEKAVHLAEDSFDDDEIKMGYAAADLQKNQNYLSQSAVSLRCRVMPPPCLRNSFLMDAPEMDLDPFGSRRSKCAGYFPQTVGRDGLSRYHTDFHEIEKIGNGNFSCVFKALKRIDGCLYAVKYSTRQLFQDSERRKALMEVQALAALGFHENIVGYYSSWFENEQLYIQMELCDHSLSFQKSTLPLTEGEVLIVMHQIAKALLYIHDKGIAHLDVKPDNIYVKNDIYKLGDFGCATLVDKSLLIEEGDARYMPQEILNDNYDYLNKVDIFSLGVTVYELVRGSPLPESGPQSLNLREGKLPLLPSYSVQFQNLLKLMLDPDPVQRPSAKDVVESPIFDRIRRNGRIK